MIESSAIIKAIQQLQKNHARPDILAILAYLLNNKQIDESVSLSLKQSHIDDLVLENVVFNKPSLGKDSYYVREDKNAELHFNEQYGCEIDSYSGLLCSNSTTFARIIFSRYPNLPQNTPRTSQNSKLTSDNLQVKSILDKLSYLETEVFEIKQKTRAQMRKASVTKLAAQKLFIKQKDIFSGLSSLEVIKITK